MSNQTNKPAIYLAELQWRHLRVERAKLQVQLDLLKKMPHDKQEYKRQKKEITAKMNSLTFDIDGKYAEIFKQNYLVVRQMLMMFAAMDFVTRVFDESADTFKAVTVGIKRDELMDFVELCREVATKANEVVQIIDEAGKDAMSMAYAEMEDGIGELLHTALRGWIDNYGKTPEGRKYFYGEH